MLCLHIHLAASRVFKLSTIININILKLSLRKQLRVKLLQYVSLMILAMYKG